MWRLLLIKKKRRLLLLTRRFPFNRGEVAAESYLENEIGVLSTYFDEVLAVGTEAQPGDAPTCALPGNVTPLALGCGNTSKDKALLAVKGIAFPLLGGADVREAYATESVHGIGKRVFRGYFAARAKAKADVLAEELVRFGFEPTHIYSFWLYDTALVATWLTGTYPCARAVARHMGTICMQIVPMCIICPSGDTSYPSFPECFPARKTGRNT